jgi:hypothetical protein
VHGSYNHLHQRRKLDVLNVKMEQNNQGTLNQCCAFWGHFIS